MVTETAEIVGGGGGWKQREMTIIVNPVSILATSLLEPEADYKEVISVHWLGPRGDTTSAAN